MRYTCFNSACARRKWASICAMLVLGSFIVVTRVQAIENMPDGVAQAIATGDIDTLRTILQSTPTAVQARDSDGRTPLHYCGEKPVIRGLYTRQVGKPARNWEQDHKNWLANSKDTADLLLSYGWRGCECPRCLFPHPLPFCGDHGKH